MTNYNDNKKKTYICFIEEPGNKLRLINQVEVVYDEGTSGEVSAWEQIPSRLDPIVNPSAGIEGIFDGIRLFRDGVPNEGLVRIT